MKLIVLIISTLLIVIPALAKKNLETKFHDVTDWQQFDQAMKGAERRDRQIGWSYLLSGALVSIGGTLGAQQSTDTASKLVYGISAGFGLGAAAYGTVRLLNGNDYTVFYNSLRLSSLTPAQRDELVRHYIEQERERERVVRITRIVSHIIIGGFNFYSASKDEDKNTKIFFQFLGSVNFAMALTYSF